MAKPAGSGIRKLDQPPPDAELAITTRALLARTLARPAALTVSAENGCVRIRGPVLQGERERLRSGVSKIPGIREIDLQLQIISPPYFVPASSGENHIRFEPQLYQGTRALPVRIAVGLIGALLLGLGSRSRGAKRLTLSVLGLGAVARAVTNFSLSQMIGSVTIPTIRLRRTVKIEAPVECVYAFLREFSNYPKFMSYVRDVQVNDKGGLSWSVTGPNGLRASWDAVVGAMIENQVISWRSCPDSLIFNEGSISMRSEPGGTRVSVDLNYALPAGIVGQAVAHFLSFDPRQKIDEDLQVLKSLIEGEAEKFRASISY